MTLNTGSGESTCWADLRLGDCLDIMPTLAPGSVDMVLTDPPYGTTASKWDSVIPFAPMWAGIKHCAKKNAAIVMTASQPFTSALAMSRMREFRYCWVWDKCVASGFNYARFQPMRQHEDILVFYEDAPIYDATGEQYKKPIRYKMAHSASDSSKMKHSRIGQYAIATHMKKRSILRFQKVRKGLHPTQKPIELMEYLIKTYTNPGDTVLDFTMGSGTTGVACKRLGRNFIGIELDPGYFEVAKKRITEVDTPNSLFGRTPPQDGVDGKPPNAGGVP